MAETVNAPRTTRIFGPLLILSPGFLLGILGLILILHILATCLGLYWNAQATFQGLHIDKIFHALGGFWIVVVFFYYAFRNEEVFNVRTHPWAALLFALGFTALIGVGWEFFEFGLDYYFGTSLTHLKQQHGLADTMADLFFDLVGAFMGAVLYIRTIRSRKNVG